MVVRTLLDLAQLRQIIHARNVHSANLGSTRHLRARSLPIASALHAVHHAPVANTCPANVLGLLSRPACNALHLRIVVFHSSFTVFVESTLRTARRAKIAIKRATHAMDPKAVIALPAPKDCSYSALRASRYAHLNFIQIKLQILVAHVRRPAMNVQMHHLPLVQAARLDLSCW